jgi:hypothetical protein
LGATPLKSAREARPVESLPFDPMMPATCVPWPIKIGAGQPGNEALAVDDAGTAAVRGHQVVMRVDAAVDHRHADPGAVPPGLPGDVGAHRLRGDIQSAGHGPIGRHISDQRIELQRPDLGRRQKQVDSLDVPEAPYDLVRGKLLQIGIWSVCG